MLYSEKWIREWVSVRQPVEHIADRLSMAGLEVEGIEKLKAEFTNVVVGKIVSCAPHPQADKLQLCQVDIGKNKLLDIVCGAPNARKGIKVAVALIGATLPGDIKIGKTRIRSVVSSGMLCSSQELGLGADNDGIMELQGKATLGKPLEATLNLDDRLLDIDLTPNRGDCLSILGVAREIAALYDVKIKIPDVVEISATSKQKIAVKVQAKAQCPRYIGRVIEGIDMSRATPTAIVEKLRNMGVRSINAVVDITNYVMLELGQPMHAFDQKQIHKGIIVRHAQAKEKLVMLDGKELQLDEEDLVIADHNGLLALAGVMGGELSGVNDSTTSIVLESAYFAPSAIRGRGRKYGLHTDASHRYERGVDFNLQHRAIEYATKLILDICGGNAGLINEVVSEKHLPSLEQVNVRDESVTRLLGVSIEPKKMGAYLSRLGCQTSVLQKAVKVIPPSHRFDLQGEHDFIEEIARLYGYDNIPVHRPRLHAEPMVRLESLYSVERVRDFMADRCYHEMVTYSFVDPVLQARFHGNAKSIKLKNPIAENMSVMRLSLISGLVQAFAYNYNRQQPHLKLFEIGSRYEPSKKGQNHNQRIAGLLSGQASSLFWSGETRALDFYDAKGDVQALLRFADVDLNQISYKAAKIDGMHPYQAAQIFYKSKKIGLVGTVCSELLNDYNVEHEVLFFELDFDWLRQKSVPKFKAFSKFPVVRRDLAVIVDQSLEAGQLLNAIHQFNQNNWIKQADLFDVYSGKGIEPEKKSLAVRLTLQSDEQTLNDQQLDYFMEKLLHHLQQEVGAVLR